MTCPNCKTPSTCSFNGCSPRQRQEQPTELQRIHAVVMNVGGDWPDDESDPYTLRHVKWMARELNKRKD